MKGKPYYDEMYTLRHGKHLCGSTLAFHASHFATQTMKKHCLHGCWLDLGCGCGEKNWHVARANPVEIVGLDFSSVALRYAHTLLPQENLQWVRGDVTTLPFATALFDGCICSHVLEHVGATRRLLTEAVRVTKRGGRLIIIVPHGHHHDDPSHLWYFTPGQLASLLFSYGAVEVNMSSRDDQIAAIVYLGGVNAT